MIRIRPFYPSDQEAAQTLILNGLGEHFGAIDHSLNPDLGDIWRAYIAPGNLFVVAEVEGILAGTGALIQEALDIGRIVRMSVSRQHRRLGIGRALVNHLLQMAQQRGYRQVLVETNLDWYDAIGLYRACGFTEYARDQESVHLLFRVETGK